MPMLPGNVPEHPYLVRLVVALFIYGTTNRHEWTQIPIRVNSCLFVVQLDPVPPI